MTHDTVCGPREALPTIMWDQYGEVLAWQGVAVDGSLIELYLSLEGTWTVVQVNGAVACSRANGEDWMIPTTSYQGPET